MGKASYDEFAAFYDKTVPDSWYEGYANFVIKLAHKAGSSPKSVLELACGTGRLAQIFYNKGYAVEGLDLSNPMLKEARKRGLKVYKADMTNFKLSKKYDMIVCVNYSLNHLLTTKALGKCFTSVKKHLDRDGCFIFDIELLEKGWRGNTTVLMDSGPHQIVLSTSPKGNIWVTRQFIFEKTRGSMYKRHFTTIKTRSYTLPMIRTVINDSGLTLLNYVKSNPKVGNQYNKIFICKPK
jgi:SAM-dependent methyltransferase